MKNARAANMMRCFPILGVLAVACTVESVPPTPTSDNSESEPVDESPVACVADLLALERSDVTIEPQRDHHATLVRETSNGPFLYVLGGGTDEFRAVHADIQRAEIRGDGSLGAFSKIGELPRGRAGTGVAVVRDVIILTGGVSLDTSPPIVKETIYARIGEDGSIGEWKTGPDLPRGVMHPSSVASGDWVYVFGGTTGNDATTVSVRAKLEPDGKLSDFEPTTKLSPARSHQAAFVHGGFIYLAGGLSEGPQTNPPSRTDVVRAEIRPDGSLGEWLEAGTLPVPLSVSSAEVRGCSVYFFGGLSNNKSSKPFTDTVLRGTLAEDGSVIDVVVERSKLSVERGHVHQTPSYGKFIYSVGGRGNDALSSLGTVDVGTFSAP